jgi:hypothetical protein
MPASPVFAPYSQTFATRESYLTVAEYVNSPTAVNVSQLVAGGTALQNADALVQVLARASSWADTICHQVLAATLETQIGKFRQRPDGISVVVDFTPVVQVVSVAIGSKATALIELTDLSGVDIDRKVLILPVAALPSTADRVAVRVAYVAGFANGITIVAAAAGASTLTLDNTLGVGPGMSLMVYDPGTSEAVTVASTSGNTITLAAPLRYPHATGVNASAMPPIIKQAVVLLASALIKTKGAQAIVMQSMSGQPSSKQARDVNGTDEESLARMMLRDFARII